MLHFPYVIDVDWTLAGELRTLATFFAVAVVWDYLWFVLNPACTVRRFESGNGSWFEVSWLWRFPTAPCEPTRRRPRARPGPAGCPT